MTDQTTAPNQCFENTLYLVHSGPSLCTAFAGRNEDGTSRFLGAEHRASNEAARAEGIRLGMRYWGPNGGPFAPIDAPYPGKGYTGHIQEDDGGSTYYVDGERYTGIQHLRSGSIAYVDGKRCA